MPRIVACDEVVGTTAAFGGAVPVVGLIVDQQAALLAAGLPRAGHGEVHLRHRRVPARPDRDGAVRVGVGPVHLGRVAAARATSYCLDGQVYTAASAVRWLVDLGLLERADDLDTGAAPSSDGVLFVPGSPGSPPRGGTRATATFTGMTLATGRGTSCRALLEGVAAPGRRARRAGRATTSARP